MSPGIVPADAGLIARFRSAGAKIAWRDATGPRGGRSHRRARIAHLNDEDARVEVWGRAPSGGMEVESGPLGALILILEIDRRGALASFESREADVDPGFPQGAVRATWGGQGRSAPGPTVRDLIELARYALA